MDRKQYSITLDAYQLPDCYYQDMVQVRISVRGGDDINDSFCVQGRVEEMDYMKMEIYDALDSMMRVIGNDMDDKLNELSNECKQYRVQQVK